jgi:hypothetical protein
MSLIDWSRNQADEIVACARRHLRRLDERGVRQTPSPPSARNHGKRHSVNKERSHEARAKAAQAKRAMLTNRSEATRRREIVRAYYAGEIPDLSALKD